MINIKSFVVTEKQATLKAIAKSRVFVYFMMCMKIMKY